MSPSQIEFNKRIARISSGAVASKQLLFVGMDEVYLLPKREHMAKREGFGDLLGKAMYPVLLLMAVALGGVSHASGQVMRYHLLGMPEQGGNPDIEMAAQLVIGFCIAMVLGYGIGLRARAFMALQLLGAALGVLFFHNAVHLWPGVFAALCSQSWVDRIVTLTAPHSMLWRGIGVVF